MLALSPAPAEVPGPDGLPASAPIRASWVRWTSAGSHRRTPFPAMGPAAPSEALALRAYTTPEVVAVMAVAEMGYAANAFFAALNLREKQPLVDVTLLGPPAPLSTVSDAMSRGLSARFRVPGARFRFARPGQSNRYRHSVELSALRRPRSGRVTFEGEALVTGAPPPLSLIAPVPGSGSVDHPGGLGAGP